MSFFASYKCNERQAGRGFDEQFCTNLLMDSLVSGAARTCAREDCTRFDCRDRGEKEEFVLEVDLVRRDSRKRRRSSRERWGVIVVSTGAASIDVLLERSCILWSDGAQKAARRSWFTLPPRTLLPSTNTPWFSDVNSPASSPKMASLPVSRKLGRSRLAQRLCRLPPSEFLSSRMTSVAFYSRSKS